MSVAIRVTTRRFRLRRRRIAQRAQNLLGAAGFAHADLSLSLVGDRAMRRLNRVHRGRDRATDVLSFPLYAPAELARVRREQAGSLLGDIVISLDTAARQARGYEATLDAEIDRLLIHGILHLLGHDHEAPADATAMRRHERRLARAIALPWPYAASDNG
ncbi:MAG: rRNA maturation RNase YbeY [Vulcanimicrobiaceae bacterium]